MKKTRIFLLCLVFIGAVVSCSKFGDSTTTLISPDGITQFAIANNGGNVTCDEVALNVGCTFEATSGKMDYLGGTGGKVGPISWTTDGTYIDWTSEVPVKVAFIVKGGNNANVYFSGCNSCVTSGTALSAPVNTATGRPYGLSNLTICYSICEPEPPSKIVAFKGYLYPGEKVWVVTGGGPDHENFIWYHNFVAGGNYPLYLYGELGSPAGTLEVGNFDTDALMEVRITCTLEGLAFIEPHLFVGDLADFSPYWWEFYPYPDPAVIYDPAKKVAIIDLPF